MTISGAKAIGMNRRQRRNLRTLEGDRIKVPGIQQPRKEYQYNRREARKKKLLKQSEYEKLKSTEVSFLDDNFNYEQ